jgi:putative transcriptional regulator
MFDDSSKTKPRIHNRLTVLRAERGLSRQELAAALDVNYQTVGYLERGDYSPSLELAFRISEYFDLPIEAIFSRRPFEPLSRAIYGNGDAGRERREAEAMDIRDEVGRPTDRRSR